MVFRQRNSQRSRHGNSHRRARSAPLDRWRPPRGRSGCRAQRLRDPRALPAGRRASSTSGATPAARCCTSTTRCTSRTRSSTCWCATSRRRCMPPTATPARRAKSAWRWSPPGPGVTNAVTGIATAYMDSIPMVIVTGQVPTPAIGLDAFQECDTVGITRPIVKHNFLVKDVRDLAMTMKKAFHIARTGRPGPGGGRHPEGRVAEDRAVPLPGDGRDALVQPGAQGPRRADPQGGAAAAAAPSGPTSTPAAASSWATPRPSCASWSTCSAFPAPTR